MAEKKNKNNLNLKFKKKITKTFLLAYTILK